MGLNKTLLASIIASMGKFSPLSLFSGAIQGAWYDANDLSTLWQDTSGTVPAVVNAKVARINDKSGNNNHVTQATAGAQAYLRGTPTGPNLVTDPYFYTGTNWTAGAGWSIASPAATGAATSGALDYALPAVSGKWYLVKFTVQTRSAGSVTVSFGGVSIAAASIAGTYQKCVYSTSTAPVSIAGSGFSGMVRGLEVYDISAVSVSAPYYLDFDGVATFYACASMIADYPATLVADQIVYAGTNNPTTLCLYQSDVDRKSLEEAGSVDYKQAVVNAYTGGAFSATKSGVICELAAGFNVSESNLIAGTPVAHSNTWGTKTSLWLGKGYSVAFYQNGPFYGGLVLGKQLSVPEKESVRTHYSMDTAIQAWGDSMTAGFVTIGWPLRLRDSLQVIVENKGAGGETSSQIAARFAADTSSKDQWINTFWMGTNDDVSLWPATPLANIASCVAGLSGKKRYLVLGITRIEGGSISSSHLDSMDAALLSIYGSRFVDVRGYLQALNDGSVNDLADIALGLVPRSLRSDTIHLNDTGNQHVADLLAVKIKSMGWL